MTRQENRFWLPLESELEGADGGQGDPAEAAAGPPSGRMRAGPGRGVASEIGSREAGGVSGQHHLRRTSGPFNSSIQGTSKASESHGELDR